MTRSTLAWVTGVRWALRVVVSRGWPQRTLRMRDLHPAEESFLVRRSSSEASSQIISTSSRTRDPASTTMADKATRAPSKSEPKQKGPPTAIPPPKPKPSKAERRELQEKQRAAKTEATTAGPSAKPGPAKQKPQKSSADAPSFPIAASQQGAAAPSRRRSFSSSTGPGSAHDIRSLHIFSHFGLPKSSSHGIKGDIHPAIVRLALQFSEFKIVGANARCIATLTAFKTVRFASLADSHYSRAEPFAR